MRIDTLMLVLAFNKWTTLMHCHNAFFQVWEVEETGLEQEPSCDFTRGHSFLDRFRGKKCLCKHYKLSQLTF